MYRSSLDQAHRYEAISLEGLFLIAIVFIGLGTYYVVSGLGTQNKKRHALYCALVMVGLVWISKWFGEI